MDYSPLWISIKIALTSTIITFFTGVLAAWLVYHLNRGAAVIDGIFTLPMVLPPTVVGFFLLVIFGKNNPVGHFLNEVGLPLVFTWEGAVIAASVVAFPLMYRAARGAFEQLDQDFIDCARTLSMGEWRIFRQIILPNCWPGVLSGVVLAFARSMGEFGATTLLAGNIPGRTRTMALAVYSAVQNNDNATATYWSIVIVIISFTAIYLINLSTRKNNRVNGRSYAQERGDKTDAVAGEY